MTEDNNRLDALELATELTIAWLGNQNTRASSDEVAAFLSRMQTAVKAVTQEDGSAEVGEAEPASTYEPATTIRRSLASKDHIISMIDGKPYKTLRRHLRTHGLTPAEYRTRYNLKPDYPMVAPNYSETRRSMAKKIGLGRKARQVDNAPVKASPKSRSGSRKDKQQPQAE